MARQEPVPRLSSCAVATFPGVGLATHLARRLHQWSTDNPDPYPGPHRL